jgi:pimeloyl-ACP methyl ester carboxylesterase
MTSTGHTYLTTPTQRVEGAQGTTYAYRDQGDGGEIPVVLFQHFRGNLDNWDPVLIDALAANRRVVTFDNAGVGASSGATPHTVAEMAADAVAFLEALELDRVDLLGFSIGSFVAQTAGQQSAQRIFGARADDLADPPGPIRRGLLMGDTEPRDVGAGQLNRVPRLHCRRRRRPDDLAALLLSARGPDPTVEREDLSGRRPRFPLPTRSRVRRRH